MPHTTLLAPSDLRAHLDDPAWAIVDCRFSRADARRVVLGQKKKEGGVSLRFATTGTARDDGQYLILDTQGQPPGRYVLSLRVRDRVTGEWVEASREVFLE